MTLTRRGSIICRMIVAVIPARYGSTRLPGKPLAEIAGKPLIEHVYRRVSKARSVDKTLVATDREEIASAVKKFGGEAVMTGECRTGTDRAAQALADVDCSIVVNVQGDEPLIPPEMIEQVLRPFKADESLQMSSLKRLFRQGEDPSEQQAVKVVTDREDNALYFSRSLVPFPRNPAATGPFLHVGIYAYTRDFLMEFTSWPSTPLEMIEGLEQLRALEHGRRIKVPTTEHFSIGVDTPEDLERVRKLIKR